MRCESGGIISKGISRSIIRRARIAMTCKVSAKTLLINYKKRGETFVEVSSVRSSAMSFPSDKRGERFFIVLSQNISEFIHVEERPRGKNKD